MIIGVTGQIGSGKSTAARILKSMGAAIIDADLIGREVVENNPDLRHKLQREFGTEIVSSTGQLKRKKLAKIAFADEPSRKKLNRLVHPYLLRELRKQMMLKARVYEVTVLDAALLLEWNLDREIDAVILIHASEMLRIKRLRKRGVSRRDALLRQRRQLSYTEQRRRADYVIYNRTTEDDLARKLKQVLLIIKRKSVDL